MAAVRGALRHWRCGVRCSCGRGDGTDTDSSNRWGGEYGGVQHYCRDAPANDRGGSANVPAGSQSTSGRRKITLLLVIAVVVLIVLGGRFTFNRRRYQRLP